MPINQADEATYGRIASTLPFSASRPVAVLPQEGEAGTPSAPDAELRLRSAALREVSAWKPVTLTGGEAYRLVEERWQKASESIGSAEKRLNQLIQEACELPEEVRPLTDNARRVRAALRELSGALKRNDLRELPQIEDQLQAKALRVYRLARNFLDTVHFNFEVEAFLIYLSAAQEQQPLQIKEAWALKPMLQLALLEKVGVAAQAFCSNGEKPELESEARGPSLAQLVLGLQEVDQADWGQFFDQISQTEKILSDDPAGIYPRMDSASRSIYRQTVTELAAHSDAEETEVAARAITLARQAQQTPDSDVRRAGRQTHVGFYLVDAGKKLLEKQIHYRPPFDERVERTILRWPELCYVLSIELTTVALIAFLLSGLHLVLPVFAAIVLLLLPATESAVRIVNQLVSFLIRPRRLAKLDFSEGIPADCATMVVIPTLLISKQQVQEIVSELEVRYLASADPNLHFALLTDSPDSTQPLDEADELVGFCTRLIEELNRKYAEQRNGSFFLFHRHRVYNAAQGAWMGWERKRGKILDLNNLLRHNFDSFPVKIGDLSVLPKVRYVITLDADTQLPRDAARQLVGTIAHPLNRAILDPGTNTVIEGYAILQPRVGISIHSATRSRLASIYSGQTGFDIYTHAISDVYQDLFGEGSFTGKGIYEVDVYQRVLAQRFPSNALLSHDLLEGSYARTGLVSDIEVIDDYPSHFSAYSRRKHRWVRGDWQILRWLLPRVPNDRGDPVANPLSFISRWKIIDNLRRSLIEAATFALLLGGWFFLPGGALYWTVATLILLLIPTYLQLFLSLTSVSGHNWKGALKDAGASFITDQVNVLLTLAFLAHQTLITLDAVIRTVVRLALTHKRLLEWETAAQAELKMRKRTPVEMCLDLTPWLSLSLGAALLAWRPHALPVALPFLAVWACTKLMCRWLDLPLQAPPGKLAEKQQAILHHAALRTWSFFRQWSHAGTRWLIPDNIQESPLLVAKVISPTNLGLLLNARLAAYDLGYLTLEEFTRETGETLKTVQQFSRHKGHFFNWNHMETLKPLEPLFVSAVDNGNLAACLWTLKQGCLEMIREPLFRGALWQGVRDHLGLLAELDGGTSPRAPAISALKDLRIHTESLEDDAVAWASSLPQLERKAREIEKMLPPSGGQSDEECRWWVGELTRRLENLKRMGENLAPWLLPEHQSLFQHPGLRGRPDVRYLALGTLPEALAGLDVELQKLMEDPTVDESLECAARTFRGMIRSCNENAQTLLGRLQVLADTADAIVAEMDFRFLYNRRRKLLSIGYNLTDGRLEIPCYDLLASEARIATFVAIAKGDIPQESWFRLGRAHTLYRGERALLSWAGTMFEYLMPTLWMKSYLDTILGQSQHAAVRCQQKLGRRKRRPWGVSEAGYSKKDHAGYYQYQAFGIPALAVKPDVSADVVTPYATFLASQVDPAGAAKNLIRMKRLGWLGALGFYESADYNQARAGKPALCEVVKSWMAHHQGMSLVGLSNLLAASAAQRRFHAEPRVKATELLLHEKVPATIPITSPERNEEEELHAPPPFSAGAP